MDQTMESNYELKRMLRMQVDTLIKNGRVFNTFSQQFEAKEIAIKDGKILMVGPGLSFEATKIVDAQNQYLIPGLVDAHMHIESSMTDPSNFGNEAIKFGTTTVIADAHEITNVAGIRGLKDFMAQKSLIDVFYALPSSVPSTNSEMETTGGVIGVKETEELLLDPRIVCLGEAMNFKGIVSEPESLIRQIIKRCKELRPTMPLEGHCPKYSGLDLAKFAFSGISSDHTFQTPATIVERINDGMFIEFQKKSMSVENMQTIIDNDFYEYASFVTDDVMADDLVNGHLNLIVKEAIEMGLPVEKAIYMATFTPARRMSLNDRGAIAPGRVADIIFLDDVQNFSITDVYKNGKSVQDLPKVQAKFPEYLKESIHAKKITTDDLQLKSDQTSVTANIIEINQQGTFTKRVKEKLLVKDGVVDWQSAGLALLMIQERYNKSGQISFAFVKNAISKSGAIGSTWAHDHHNLMVMGTDLVSIVEVQHKILAEQGGYVVAKNGQVVANAPLRIGGVVSEEPIEKLAQELKQVRHEMQELGYHNFNEIMSFSTISLLVSPALKISDKGMFDVKTQTPIPLFE